MSYNLAKPAPPKAVSGGAPTAVPTGVSRPGDSGDRVGSTKGGFSIKSAGMLKSGWGVHPDKVILSSRP